MPVRLPMKWAKRNHAYIAPGSLWENGYAESFHSKLVDELLSQEEFESMREAWQLTSAWRKDYNEHRPHSSLGYPTPERVRGPLPHRRPCDRSLCGFRSGS